MAPALYLAAVALLALLVLRSIGETAGRPLPDTADRATPDASVASRADRELEPSR